jgi:hypothetical protein
VKVSLFDWAICARPSAVFLMDLVVTRNAKRDQILFIIGSGVTSELQMMYMQLSNTAAELAAPAVPLENFVA